LPELRRQIAYPFNVAQDAAAKLFNRVVLKAQHAALRDSQESAAALAAG